MNTFFQKPDIKLCTYEEPGVKGPPIVRHRYEMIDYILANNRTKNTINNVESDYYAGIPTPHFPVIANIKIKLKNKPLDTTHAKRIDYNPCSIRQFQHVNGCRSRSLGFCIR